MTLPEATDLLAYWHEHPPIHLLMPALMSPWVRLKGTGAVADYAPATRISPMGDGVGAQAPGVPASAAPHKPGGEGAALAALAKRNGGRVSMDMLLGLKR